VSERDPFDLAGVTIDGKYRVASVVGDGGFGVVYRGVHKGFGELIAIKCLKVPQDLDEAGRAELLEKLQDEGRLLHRLSKLSSGIVQALDVGAFTTPSERWVPYLVLEWLEGQTLGAVLKQREERGEGGMSVAAAIELLGPAARALAIAHQQKIAHRDVKPANIFLAHVGDAADVVAKVIDFGIAKWSENKEILTGANVALGSPSYMSPEQIRGQKPDARVDAWALAVVAFTLVTGEMPFVGRNGPDIAKQVVMGNRRPIPSTVVDAARLERFFGRAFARSPEARFGSVEELAGEFVLVSDAPGALRTAARAAADARRRVHPPEEPTARDETVTNRLTRSPSREIVSSERVVDDATETEDLEKTETDDLINASGGAAGRTR